MRTGLDLGVGGGLPSPCGRDRGGVNNLHLRVAFAPPLTPLPGIMPEACLRTRRGGNSVPSTELARCTSPNSGDTRCLSSLTGCLEPVSLALFGVLIGLWRTVATMGSGLRRS